MKAYGPLSIHIKFYGNRTKNEVVAAHYFLSTTSGNGGI